MSAIIKGYKSGAPNAACNVRALLLWPLVSIHMCTTCEYNMYVAGSSSYILLLIPIFHQYWKYCSQMAGLGQLVRRLDLFCVRGRHWGEGGEGGCGIASTCAHSPTQGHTIHTVHGCKISNIHGMASRLIDRLRQCVLHFTGLHSSTGLVIDWQAAKGL